MPNGESEKKRLLDLLNAQQSKLTGNTVPAIQFENSPPPEPQVELVKSKGKKKKR